MQCFKDRERNIIRNVLEIRKLLTIRRLSTSKNIFTNKMTKINLSIKINFRSLKTSRTEVGTRERLIIERILPT